MAEGPDGSEPHAPSTDDLPPTFTHVPVRAFSCRRTSRTCHHRRRESRRTIDATLGLGGHAEHFLRTYPRLHLIGLDRDPDALAIARIVGSTSSVTESRWYTPRTTVSPTRSTRPACTPRTRFTRFCSTSVCRRCSSTRPTAGSPTRSTHLSTCGWIRRSRADRGGRPQHLQARRHRPHPQHVRRGAVRRQDRVGRSYGA